MHASHAAAAARLQYLEAAVALVLLVLREQLARFLHPAGQQGLQLPLRLHLATVALASLMRALGNVRFAPVTRSTNRAQTTAWARRVDQRAVQRVLVGQVLSAAGAEGGWPPDQICGPPVDQCCAADADGTCLMHRVPCLSLPAAAYRGLKLYKAVWRRRRRQHSRLAVLQVPPWSRAGGKASAEQGAQLPPALAQTGAHARCLQAA